MSQPATPTADQVLAAQGVRSEIVTLEPTGERVNVFIAHPRDEPELERMALEPTIDDRQTSCFLDNNNGPYVSPADSAFPCRVVFRYVTHGDNARWCVSCRSAGLEDRDVQGGMYVPAVEGVGEKGSLEAAISYLRTGAVAEKDEDWAPAFVWAGDPDPAAWSDDPEIMIDTPPDSFGGDCSFDPEIMAALPEPAKDP